MSNKKDTRLILVKTEIMQSVYSFYWFTDVMYGIHGNNFFLQSKYSYNFSYKLTKGISVDLVLNIVFSLLNHRT